MAEAVTAPTEATEIETPDVSMCEIDTAHLGDVDENREAVQFRVILSEKPSDVWVTEFDTAYRQTPYLLKPPVQVVGNALVIVYLPRYTSELPGFFRFLALILRRANEETRRTAEMHLSNAQERRKAEFREALRHIELPQE